MMGMSAEHEALQGGGPQTHIHSCLLHAGVCLGNGSRFYMQVLMRTMKSLLEAMQSPLKNELEDS